MKGSADNTVLLRNARLVEPKRIVDKASLLIQDGLIKQIFYSETSLSEATVDLAGLTLFPGFIDVHIHGAVGVDTMEASADLLRKVSDFLATQGVTAWLPTLVPGPVADYARAVQAIDQLMTEQNGGQGSARGAKVLGVHYEGPFVNTAQCGALRSEHFRSFSTMSEIEDLPVPEDPNAVRMMTLAPEIEGGVELVHELNSRGWIISIGHTRAELDALNRAFAAGARHLTHFMNAMPSLHHRSPGPVGWGLSRDDVTCDIIADGIHLDSAMVELLLKLKTSERLTLISDSIAAAGQGDGEYEIWGETISVTDGRTRNTRGSIAGSVITMLDAVSMMRSLRASDMDVARMSATNPARLLRIDDRYGSIEEGKRADLVALDESGNVRLTLVGGEIAFDSAMEVS